MTDEDRKQIIQLRKQGLGYKAIGSALNLTRDSVRGFCKRNNLDGHADIVKLNIQVMKEKEILCLNCGKPFKTKKQGRPRKYCSDFCRRSWWNKNKDKIQKNDKAIYKYTCNHCGKKFSVYGNKKRKYCSHDCYIKYRFWRDEDEV